MSHTNKDHKEELSERSYIAAAHREDRSEESRLESLEKAQEIHFARTGTELKEDLEKNEDKVAQPGLADTEEGRRERAFIAAAHREGRDEEGKKESLEKASALHEERTGEPLAELEELNKDSKDSNTDSKEHKKDDRIAQPGLAETEEGRKERAYIAAAHREGRDEEGKKESLEKASALHEERTGEPLAELEELKEDAKEHKKHKKESKKAKDSKKSKESKSKKSPKKAAKDDEHLERQERSLVGAAHRKGRDQEAKMESLAKASKIHEERTGEPLPEAVEKGAVEETPHKRHHEDDTEKESHKRQKIEDDKSDSAKDVEQPGLAGSAAGRHERAYIAAAHRDGRSEEGQLDSLQKASELHEKRTGEPLPEALERGVAAQ